MDEDVARYILARCLELERLTDHLDNEVIARLLREAIDKTQQFIDRGGPHDS